MPGEDVVAYGTPLFSGRRSVCMVNIPGGGGTAKKGDVRSGRAEMKNS